MGAQTPFGKKKKPEKPDKSGWINGNGVYFRPGKGTVYQSRKDENGNSIYSAYPSYDYEDKEFTGDDAFQEARKYIDSLEEKGCMWKKGKQ